MKKLQDRNGNWKIFTFSRKRKSSIALVEKIYEVYDSFDRMSSQAKIYNF